jgi:hypothetical protein
VDLVEIEKLANFRALQDVEDGPCGQTGCIGLDGDPQTDRYVNVLWLDIQGAWSSEAAELLTASLIASADATEMTTIRFTGVAAAGYQLVARSLDVTFEEGDVTVDGRVDASDIDALSQAILVATQDPRFDLNRDQVVDAADREYLIEEVLRTWEGDANLDRHVDELDFAIWNAHRFESDTSWSTGDFDGDGKSDVRDFLLWNTNKRRSP